MNFASGIGTCFAILLLIVLNYLLVIYFQLVGFQVPDWPPTCPDKDYITTITLLADADNTIILAMVDEAFADMAINLYETSLQPFDIQNYLFVGAGVGACAALHRWNPTLHCVTYRKDMEHSQTASIYGTLAFMAKMNMRTDMILDALEFGFTVIHTDLDMLFLKNPLPEVKAYKADIATMWDSGAYNAGFLIVRPTNHGMSIYKKMRSITEHNPRIDDQTALNNAISIYARKGASVKLLDKKTFLSGFAYYEGTRRMFAGESPCKVCIVLHNNWIATKEGKVYRFKEHHMWLYDGGEYYSSTTRRYLVYDTPFYLNASDKVTLGEEKRALRDAFAIADLLNRTVILPTLHCGIAGSQTCPLNSRYKMSNFDNTFGGKYREHMFISHPKVPSSVRAGARRAHVILGVGTKTLKTGNRTVFEAIATDIVNATSKRTDQSTSVITHVPANPDGASQHEILAWFGSNADPVLTFRGFYRPFHKFAQTARQLIFTDRVNKAFKTASYRQL